MRASPCALRATLILNVLILCAVVAAAGYSSWLAYTWQPPKRIPSKTVAKLMMDPKRSLRESVGLVEYTYKIQDAAEELKPELAKMAAIAGSILAGALVLNTIIVLKVLKKETHETPPSASDNE